MEFFRNTVNRLLKPLDLALLPRDVQWERDVLLALYESSRTWRRKDFQFPVECIVFSKDRALQLHALLSSYFEKINVPPRVHILYQTSTAAHQQAYEEVRSLFAGMQTCFIRQGSTDSFREDVIRLLDSIRSEKIFFWWMMLSSSRMWIWRIL